MLNVTKYPLEDAKKQFEFDTDWEHIAKAMIDRNRGKTKQRSCVLWHAITSLDGIIDAVFAKEIARVWFKDGDKIRVLRYQYIYRDNNGQYDSGARDIAAGFDKFGGAQPHHVILYPPTGVRRLEYQRSAQFRAIRQRSKKKPPNTRRKHKTYAERTHMDGQRRGLGQHDSIA